MTDDLIETEPAHSPVPRIDTVARIARILDYLFAVLYVLLMVRLVLDFLQARKGNGFVEFIRAITDPFYAPFKGIVASNSVSDGTIIVWPLVVAIVGYILLHAALRGLLKLIARG
jgi:uncharacterized protein YggT (Ycf19 family)